MSTARKEQATLNAMEIELLPILRGLQLSIHLGIQHLVIGSDSLLVTTEFAKLGFSKAAIGNITKEAKELITLFNSCAIQYANRSYNAAAHALWISLRRLVYGGVHTQM